MTVISASRESDGWHWKRRHTWRHADAAQDTKLASFRRHSEIQAGAMLTRPKTPRWCHADATRNTRPVSFRHTPHDIKLASKRHRLPPRWTSTGDVHWTSTVTSTVTSN